MALGVVPFLLPGVGLPPEKRSKFLQYLLQTGKELSILEVNYENKMDNTDLKTITKYIEFKVIKKL